MGINAVLESQVHSDKPGSNFRLWKRLIGTVFSISKYFRSKGQRLRSPHGIFVNGKDLLREFQAFLKLLGPPDNQIWAKISTKMQFSCHYYFNVPGKNCLLIEAVWAVLGIPENLRSKGQKKVHT